MTRIFFHLVQCNYTSHDRYHFLAARQWRLKKGADTLFTFLTNNIVLCITNVIIPFSSSVVVVVNVHISTVFVSGIVWFAWSPCGKRVSHGGAVHPVKIIVLQFSAYIPSQVPPRSSVSFKRKVFSSVDLMTGRSAPNFLHSFRASMAFWRFGMAR